MKTKIKKCIVIPDSYKGTLSSFEICKNMKSKIIENIPDCNVLTFPVADGGEGTVDCFLHALNNARKISLTASGPFGDLIPCCYARFDNTAIIEMAQTAGLPLVENHPNPRTASTYGVGEMILHAVRNGCTQIIIGLGGSCTNDAGVGCANALGVDFYDVDGMQFLPTADTLSKIHSFDITKANQLLKHCSVTAMCDIDNPMYGQNGAAYVFAPQKGADEQCVKDLDDNLRALASVFETHLERNIAVIPGAGAAGAMGAGIIAFLGGTLKSGIDTVLDLIHFDDELKDTDLVFTGEGKIDRQSLEGKAVIGIAKRAKKQNVPVIAVVGTIGDGVADAYALGINAIFSINISATDYHIARYHSTENMLITMDNIIKLLLL